MSGRKTRASANAPENATLSVNERILKDCHSLYVDEERGEQTGSHFGFEGTRCGSNKCLNLSRSDWHFSKIRLGSPGS